MGKGDSLKSWDDRKRRYAASVSTGLGVPLELESRKGSRWARSSRGPVALLGSDEAATGDRWWFGVREKEFRDRRALGVILLCRSGDQLVDFGLGAAQFEEILPQLSLEPGRGERKLNVLRHGDRFVLQVPGGRQVDLTAARGNLAWLASGQIGDIHQESDSPTSPASFHEPTAAFFARVRRGILEPLDGSGLADGEIVLVRATRTGAVPTTAALRRIVARGGPASLPADFADQHDHYARGAARR